MRLSVEKIQKSYSSKIVVDDISFKMNSGDILGLLGPNGAGKTTLFYMIAGLLKKDSGSIILDSEDVSDKDISERSNLGLSYLPQEASIFRKLTVKENILTALEQRKDLNNESKFQELNNLLEEFNLDEFSETLGIRLSGGERRRTEIARSLGSKPKFILLDEPFAGIDPIAVEDIQAVIKKLKSKNIGVLITDHNVHETLNVTDRSYLLYDGKILKSGTSKELSNDDVAKRLYLGKNFELRT